MRHRALKIAASAAEGLSVLPRSIPALLKPNRKRRPRATRRNASPSALILVGFMGAGKTTVGRTLANKLGWVFEDLDDRIERRERRMVPEIFRHSGEAAFRRAEHSALEELLTLPDIHEGKIIALGGGAFVLKDNCLLIESAGVSTIFLDAPVDELWRRCCAQDEQHAINRPLLGNLENFRDLYRARRPYYLKAALTHQTGGKTAEQIAAEIIQALGLEPKSGKRGATH